MATSEKVMSGDNKEKIWEDVHVPATVKRSSVSQTFSDARMSRKAIKRLEHFEKVRDAHKMKRRKRKEDRRRAKTEESETAERDCSRPTKKELHQRIRERMLAAMSGNSTRICIDMSMAHTMNMKEIHKLAGQIGRLYGSNRRVEKPFHIYISSLDKAGPIYDSCVRRNDGFDHYLMDMSEKSHTELFKTEDIVYLTPDSNNILEHLDSNKVYIIGGLVDETPNKFYTLTNAKEHSLQTARLPIDEYMKKSPSGTYSKILTVNQVFDILLTLYNTNDWKEALVAGVPPRKGYVLR